jgi:hypothetical protein
MILLVNSGIIEVICTDLTYYHQMSEGIASSGGIRIRRFELDGKGKE